MIASSLIKNRRRLLVALTATLALTLLAAFAGSANAADKFRYIVTIRPVSFSGGADGSVGVYGLNTSLSSTVRVIRGGVEQYTHPQGAGSSSTAISSYTVTGGDQVEVQQPTGTVVETITVPDVSMTGTAGSAAVSGRAPDGTVAFVSYESTCGNDDDDDYPVQPQGGAFTMTEPRPLVGGSRLYLTVLPGKGDIIHYDSRIPGETPCLGASAFDFPEGPGVTPDPKPFQIYAHSMRSNVATGARLVLRRGGAIVADFSDPLAVNGVSTETATQPQAGDVVELYRPHTAPAPSQTFTIPNARSVYDPSIGLVAVDAPAASRIVTGVGSTYTMFFNERTALNTQTGRSIFDYNVSQGLDPAISLKSPDYVEADWWSPDGTGTFSFASTPGDLASPALKLKLAAKFKLSKLGRKVPVSVTSSEAATASLKLTLPAKLKTAKAKSKAPRIVASAKVSLKPGTNKLKLKITKSGKKLLKRLRGRHYPNQTATLTVTAIDPSGNAATRTKSTKLVTR